MTHHITSHQGEHAVTVECLLAGVSMFLNSSQDIIPGCMHILWTFMPQTAGRGGEGRGGEGEGKERRGDGRGWERRGMGGQESVSNTSILSIHNTETSTPSSAPSLPLLKPAHPPALFPSLY